MLEAVAEASSMSLTNIAEAPRPSAKNAVATSNNTVFLNFRSFAYMVKYLPLLI